MIEICRQTTSYRVPHVSAGMRHSPAPLCAYPLHHASPFLQSRASLASLLQPVRYFRRLKPGTAPTRTPGSSHATICLLAETASGREKKRGACVFSRGAPVCLVSLALAERFCYYISSTFARCLLLLLDPSVLCSKALCRRVALQRIKTSITTKKSSHPLAARSACSRNARCPRAKSTAFPTRPLLHTERTSFGSLDRTGKVILLPTPRQQLHHRKKKQQAFSTEYRSI